MRTKAFKNFSVLLQRNLRRIFFVLFISGMLIGGYLARSVHSSFFALVHTAGNGMTSVWGLAVVLLIPLLISFFALYFNIPVLILPIALLKSVIFGFCSCCVIFAYDNAGWLARALLLFSDSTMMVVLCWYWIRHLDGSRFRLKQNTALCLYFAMLIGMVDYMYISPFTAMLLQR